MLHRPVRHNDMFTKLVFIITFLLCVYAVNISAQCPVMPQGTVCLTQAEMNKAASNALTVLAQDKEIAVLKTQLAQKDISIKQAQDTAKQNEADLKAQNLKLAVDYATAQGQLIGANAEIVRQSATIEFLLKNGRVKQNGLINLKF